MFCDWYEDGSKIWSCEYERLKSMNDLKAHKITKT